MFSGKHENLPVFLKLLKVPLICEDEARALSHSSHLPRKCEMIHL